MKWRKITLGELCDQYNGKIQTGPFGSQLHQRDYKEIGTPIVMPKDIVNDRISIDSIARIGDKDVQRLFKHILGVGDIVFPRRGDISKRALVDENTTGFICGTGCLKISVDSIQVDNKYLFYILSTEESIIWLENNAVGSTMKNLSGAILKKLPIELPSSQTQRRIASILSAYDDLIENNLKRIKLLEEAAQNIYREWFVHFRFPGHEQTKMGENGLPEGWEEIALSKICIFISGFAFKSGTYSKSGRYKIVTIKNVKDRRFDNSNFDFIEEIPNRMNRKCIINEGDILLSLTGNVGRTCIAFGDDILLNQRVAIIESVIPKNRPYLYFLFGEDAFIHRVENLSNGVAQQNLSPVKLAELKIVFPTYQLLSKFYELADPIMELIVDLTKANNVLQEARDILLPRLMNQTIVV